MDFRPDLPQDNPGVLNICRHVIPDKNRGYRTSYLAGGTGWTTAISGECSGARMMRNSQDARRFYVASQDKLYEFGSSGTVTDLSRTVGGAYNFANGCWFTAYQDEVIAASLANATQTSTGGANFTALSGAPKCRVMLAQKGHLLALCYDDGTLFANGVKWSSQDSSIDWTASASNSAGNAFLRETPGAIRGGAELHDIVAVWKRTSMYIGQRVGGDEIWEFNLLSPYIGILGQEAWAATPLGIIFASNNGIYLFDGSVPRPIDQGIRQKIYRSLSSTPEATVMSHDEASGCVFIWTKNNGVCWCYNYLTDRWSEAYNGTSLGSASFSDFKMAVRDTNYDDYRNLGGTSNTSRRTHLVFGTENKLCNLATFGNGTGINPTFDIYTVRDPKAGVLTDSQLDIVIPSFGFDQEGAAFAEPATGTALFAPRSRISGGGSGATYTATLDANKRFHTSVVGNSIATTLTFTAEKLVLTDISYSTKLAGNSP